MSVQQNYRSGRRPRRCCCWRCVLGFARRLPANEAALYVESQRARAADEVMLAENALMATGEETRESEGMLIRLFDMHRERRFPLAARHLVGMRDELVGIVPDARHWNR